MNGKARRVMVVHDGAGKAIAVMPAEEQMGASGVRTGFRPVPKRGQHVVEIELDHEQEHDRLDELLQCEVLYTGQKASLRRKVPG